MNQGIRTLIYLVNDAQRSSMFFASPCVDPMGVFPVLERNSTLLPLNISHSFDHPSLHA
jgi:hypothetical protein